MPVEIVAFSDHHAHNFQYGSERKLGEVCGRKGYYNSRFLASLDIIKEIGDYAEAHDAHVLFGGDLFHQRSGVATEVLMGTSWAIDGLASRALSTHLIPGNHDYADREGLIHSLLGIDECSDYHEYFQPARLGDQSCSWDLPDLRDTSGDWDDVPCVRIHTIPFRENKEHFIQDVNRLSSALDTKYFNILLAHQGIQGSTIGSDFVLTSSHDISVTDIPDNFNLCLFGHYHKHQEVKDNVYYIGASHQHNWGDANDPRGFLHITVNDDFTYKLKHVETNSAPKFYVTNKAIQARPIDFVKSTNEALVAKDFGNPRVFENIEVTVDEEETKFETPTWALDDVLSAWVLAKKAPDDYLSVGKQLLEAVKDK